MTDENTDPSSGSTLRELFDSPRGSRRHSGRLLAQIPQSIEAGAGVHEVVGLVDQLRLTRDRERCKELDQYLVERVTGFASAHQELQQVHTELRQQMDRLLAPPLFPARYLGSVTTGVGECARVLHGGAQRIVAFSVSLSPGDLSVGDEVFLCHELNAVIEKAPGCSRETGETAAVIRHVDGGRLVISDRDTEVVVRVSEELAAQRLRPGDLVLWDRESHIALGHLKPAEAHGYEDIDNTPSQQLGGFDRQRDDVLARFVFILANPDLARDYDVGSEGANRILLHGPPGTGKTTLMRMIASRIARETKQRCRVVTISGAELFASYVGETERNIRRSFAILNDYDGPGIVFFDEIDAIGRVRGNASGYHDDRFLGTLLAEMEGMRRTNVAVIAATNRADTLDPALRGRFSSEIEMPRPNMSAARQIFAVHLSDEIPYQPNSTEAPKTRLALIDAGVSRLYDPNADNMIASLQFRDGKRRDVAARELVSGRLIEQICAAARANAFGRHCRGGESGVSIDDMQAAAVDAIERLRGTLSKQNVASYLPDLPQDVGVVSVDTYRPRVKAIQYVRRQ